VRCWSIVIKQYGVTEYTYGTKDTIGIGWAFVLDNAGLLLSSPSYVVARKGQYRVVYYYYYTGRRIQKKRQRVERIDAEEDAKQHFEEDGETEGIGKRNQEKKEDRS